MAAKLAIYGGKGTVPDGLIQPWPQVTLSDKDAIAEVMASEKITEQQRIQSEGLAKEWAEYMSVQYCIPVNSGTAALHLCVAGVGIEPGDEVIIPAFTFWATAAAVLHHNAIPVFVDIDPITYCIDPNDIEAKITERTRAIMPVHIHSGIATILPNIWMKLTALKRLLRQKRVNRCITTMLSVSPEALGLDIPARTLREKVQAALRAEGVPTGQWQRLPVPSQKIFQNRIGYGIGCPWRCNQSTVEYKTKDYPRTVEFIDSHCYIFDVNPPNDFELMSCYVEAFHKVMDQLDAVLDVPDNT